MTIVLPETRNFSFTPRPLPVPGDLRINWRVAVTLLMLAESRAKRASPATLHVLNYAIRSSRAKSQLAHILDGTEHALNWQMPVEPAFGRAVNFVIGEGFAHWTRVAARTGLELTEAGLKAASTVTETDNLLVDERQFLGTVGKKITEDFVSRLLTAGRYI